MELIIHDRDDISYVSLEGRLDATGVEEMEQTFAAATTERGLPTVVEMSGITFMSSLGIGFLFANTKRLKRPVANSSFSTHKVWSSRSCGRPKWTRSCRSLMN